jgi:hypothetical protein
VLIARGVEAKSVKPRGKKNKDYVYSSPKNSTLNIGLVPYK